MKSPLRIERDALAKAEYNSYAPEHFPGSKEWMRNRQAAAALNAFDLAHPEIIEAIRAEQKAADVARYEAMSDFAKGGS